MLKTDEIQKMFDDMSLGSEGERAQFEKFADIENEPEVITSRYCIYPSTTSRTEEEENAKLA